LQAQAQTQALDCTFPSFVHESAVVARNVIIGANCQVRELAVVQPFARIGDNVSIGPRAAVLHMPAPKAMSGSATTAASTQCRPLGALLAGHRRQRARQGAGRRQLHRRRRRAVHE
jgi:carbonic anhydrase/acetyltransferase-like protein (isoleucine patch superfamily)